MSKKVTACQVRCIEAVSAAALETAVNTFLKGNGTPAITQEILVDPIQFFVLDGTHYQAFIVYSE